mgnify:CR=1 FL=1
MVSGVSSRPPWSTSGPCPTIASATSVDNSAPAPRPGLPGADARVSGPGPRLLQSRRRPYLCLRPGPTGFARSSGNPRDRHLTREIVPLADDLEGYPTISASTRRSHGSGVRCARCRRAWMRGTGPVGEVLHIRSGPARGGSAESCGNALKFNTVEILPCAERASLHMGDCPLKIDILGKPRNHAENSESSRGHAPLECATPAHDPGRPRPSREGPRRRRNRASGMRRPRPSREGPRLKPGPAPLAGKAREYARTLPDAARPRTAGGEGSLYEETRAKRRSRRSGVALVIGRGSARGASRDRCRGMTTTRRR